MLVAVCYRPLLWGSDHWDTFPSQPFLYQPLYTYLFYRMVSVSSTLSTAFLMQKYQKYLTGKTPETKSVGGLQAEYSQGLHPHWVERKPLENVRRGQGIWGGWLTRASLPFTARTLHPHEVPPYFQSSSSEFEGIGKMCLSSHSMGECFLIYKMKIMMEPIGMLWGLNDIIRVPSPW